MLRGHICRRVREQVASALIPQEAARLPRRVDDARPLFVHEDHLRRGKEEGRQTETGGWMRRRRKPTTRL